MRNLPTDPSAFQARVFNAFCDDLIDIGSGKSRSYDRTNAIRAIPRDAGAANNRPASDK